MGHDEESGEELAGSLASLKPRKHPLPAYIALGAYLLDPPHQV